jgi:hypothetical protein
VSQDYGNDPINWRAALPTAGRPNTVLPTGTATLVGDGTVRLAFTVQGGAIYQLQYKENLDDPEWLPFGDPILAEEDGLLVANVVIGDHPRRFCCGLMAATHETSMAYHSLAWAGAVLVLTTGLGPVVAADHPVRWTKRSCWRKRIPGSSGRARRPSRSR